MRQPIVFGKYLLLERISVGGMAEVFKAKAFGEEGFEKILAIKRILPSMAEDEEFIEMFIDEAKISGQLSHPNIGQIYELGEIDGSHFIAMEYVWGKDVLQIQNRFRRLRQKMPLPMAAYIASRVCEALDYAHRKRDDRQSPMHIIHRDVSPQNVLVSYSGEVKLIDFGIAKARSRSSKTQAGVLKGKFGYMSPEQVRALPLDQRSDVFAIGTILYEMCTGDRLFTGESDFATLEKVRNAMVPSPSKVDPRIPPVMEAIMMRALRRESDERYQWASEMQEELQALLMTQNPIFTSKTLATTVVKMFDAERKREEAALEEYKRIRKDNLAEYMKSTASGRELAVSLLPQGPPPAAEEGDGATQISSPFFAAVDDDVLTGDDLLEEIVEDGHAGEARTQIYADDAPGPAIDAPMPAEPTFIFNAESGQLVQQLPEQSTVIFAQTGGDNGGSAHDPPQGPTVIFDVSLSQAVASTAGAMPGDPSSGTMPIAVDPRSSLVKDILIGVLVAMVVILGIVLWKVFTSTSKTLGTLSTLIVSATPPRSVEVLVDDTSRGTMEPGVPMTIKELSPQEHKITVRSPGVADVQQTVQLAPGDVKVLTFTLPQQLTAHLQLMLEPAGVQVFLDGAEVSQRALAAPLELRPGQVHEVRVVKEGYKESSFSLELRPGERAERTVRLERSGSTPKSAAPSASLVITSDPPGAVVTIDGTAHGVTPLTIDLPSGRREVALSLAGYLSESTSIDLDPRKKVQKSFKLQKEKLVAVVVPAKVERPAKVEKKKTEKVERPAKVEKKKTEKVERPAKVEKKKTEKVERPAKVEKKKTEKVERPAKVEKKKTEKVERPAKVEKKKTEKVERPAKVEKKNEVGADDPKMGYLVANTTPWAKVIVDGKDTGKTTPVAPRSKIPLKPGKHKVTFEVDDKRFTFSILVKAGQITRLIQKLPVE